MASMTGVELCCMSLGQGQKWWAADIRESWKYAVVWGTFGVKALDGNHSLKHIVLTAFELKQFTFLK